MQLISDKIQIIRFYLSLVRSDAYGELSFSKGEKWYDKLFNVKYLPLFHHFKAIYQFPKHIIFLVKIVANASLTYFRSINFSSFYNSLLDFTTVWTVWYFVLFFVLFLDICKYIYMYMDNISILFVKSVHPNVFTIDFNILSGCSGIVVIKFIRDLWQVSGFLRVLWFPPSTCRMSLTYFISSHTVVSSIPRHEWNSNPQH